MHAHFICEYSLLLSKSRLLYVTLMTICKPHFKVGMKHCDSLFFSPIVKYTRLKQLLE